MEFEYNHEVGTDYATVKLGHQPIRPSVMTAFISHFERISGKAIENTGNWIFPLFITSQIIQEIVHNTCFVCGGLMKDDEYHSDHILRKCTACGHSHT